VIKKLIETQKQFGYPLISSEEIDAIYDLWREEKDFYININNKRSM